MHSDPNKLYRIVCNQETIPKENGGEKQRQALSTDSIINHEVL